jgi:hypothetical protein
MNFDPKTKEEAFKVNLLPKGNYQFEVLRAEDTVSGGGQPMVRILLKVWDETGKPHPLWDVLMESYEFKLRHFCYCVGLGEMSETGKFDCDLVIGKSGVCKIYIKEDKTGEYLPKNAVADYLINNDNNANLMVAKRSEVSDVFKDDSIPF